MQPHEHPRRGMRLVAVALGTVLTSMAVAALFSGSGSAAQSRAAAGPTNTAPPVITGTAAAGKKLTSSQGTWQSSTGVAFYTYHWARCDKNGDSCANIAGAPSALTYTLTTADVGHAIRIYVTANDSGGFTTERSAPTQAVSGIPKNTALPTISGSPVTGYTLTASSGSWTSATTPTYVYLWGRCDSNGGSCHNISNARSKTYVLSNSDVGHTLLVYVTANNSAGSSTTHSQNTQVVVTSSSLPRNTRAPSISGTAQAGQTLTADAGSWSSQVAITSYAYLWARCASAGNKCANLPNANQATYHLQTADVGSRLLVYVTANTRSGFTTAHSATTPVIAPGSLPKATRLPTISGTPEVGRTLTAGVGQWTSSQPITSYGYLWGRCDTAGQRCVNIPTATNTTYTVTSADVGSRLIVYVSANTKSGYITAPSAPTATVAGLAGTPVTGGAITLANGVISIPATNVVLPNRLVIEKVSFTPNVLRSRFTPVRARFRITDVQGHVVRGALVYIVGLPYDRVTKVPESVTGLDGWVTMQFSGTRSLPLGSGGAVVFFVRARTPQGSVLAGASSRRLVQLTVGR